MFIYSVYALIKNQIVKEIIVANDYAIASDIARGTGCDEAVDCTWWGAEIGDTYKDNTFYDKDGKEREYKGDLQDNITSLQEENTKLKAENENIKNAIDLLTEII